jgi:hypothetical protein
MTDRRRFVRWKIDKDVKVKLEGAQSYANCTVNDISFAGCKISLHLKLQRDTFLKLSIVFSDESAITIEAWVTWHKAIDSINCYGVYFSKIKDADKETIYQFVRHNYPHLITNHLWKGLRKEGGETMEEEKIQDRRIFDRFSAKFPIKLINLWENSESEGEADDISAKGIGFSSKEELKPRTPLEMWLNIPDKGEPLYTRGEVVWSRMVEPKNFKIGVNLEKADLMGLSRILRIV